MINEMLMLRDARNGDILNLGDPRPSCPGKPPIQPGYRVAEPGPSTALLPGGHGFVFSVRGMSRRAEVLTLVSLAKSNSNQRGL
jgi:hypothetical protein